MVSLHAQDRSGHAKGLLQRIYHVQVHHVACFSGRALDDVHPELGFRGGGSAPPSQAMRDTGTGIHTSVGEPCLDGVIESGYRQWLAHLEWDH